MTRRAISPRLAIRIFLNTQGWLVRTTTARLTALLAADYVRIAKLTADSGLTAKKGRQGAEADLCARSADCLPLFGPRRLHRFLFHSVPRGIARRRDSLRAKREFRGIGRCKQRVVERDDTLLVPVHQRLIEALHAVGYRAILDQLRDAHRLAHVAHLVADRLGIYENLCGGGPGLLLRTAKQAERNDH